MPKNIFFMSFFYVFIACVTFIAVSVHSQPTGETAAHFAVADGYPNAGYNCSPWHRK